MTWLELWKPKVLWEKHMQGCVEAPNKAARRQAVSVQEVGGVLKAVGALLKEAGGTEGGEQLERAVVVSIV